MLHGRSLLALVASILASYGASSEAKSSPAPGNAYTIKIKAVADVGKPFRRKISVRTTGTRKLSLGERTKEEKRDDTWEEEYTETILEKGTGRPTKFQRTYTRAVVRKGDKEQARSYQGRTVVFDVKGNKYRPEVEGKPALSPADLAALAAKLPDPKKPVLAKIIGPPSAVKVNEPWALDPKLLAGAFAERGELDAGKSRGSARLVKVYERGGKQFGVIEFELDMAVKAMKQLTFDSPARFAVKGSLDTVIDGSSTAGVFHTTATLTGKGLLRRSDGKLMVEINLEIKDRRERSEEK
jgi:hypothetical protein